ncbi:MAG: type II toxin-antitoxin system VapC family toxin [Chloroflexota bacterium]|nr:type II toxin-antitoxin system VapC family toxin [Chloroflexota bacterium]
MRDLIDTDWLIDAIGGVAAASQVLDQIGQDGPAISIISVGEYLDGAFGAPDPDKEIDQLQQFLSRIVVLGIDESTMERFGRVRNYLRRRGQLIPDFDLLIASTALQHDVTLLARNIRHFSRIPNLRLYLPR